MRSSLQRVAALTLAATLQACSGSAAPPAPARPAPPLAVELDPVGEPLAPEVVDVIEGRIAAGLYPGVVVGLIDAQGPRVYGFGTRSATKAAAAAGDTPDRDTVYEI